MNRISVTPQQEFTWEARAARRGPSQAELVLWRLRESKGEWVPMPDLARVSRAYAVHSRVAELRGRGHQIEHRNRWVDGVCCSEYRLLS